MIREIRATDLEELKRIHEKFYPNDNFPDFTKLNSVVVDTDDTTGKIILCGGIELVTEGVLLSNKDASELSRGRALIRVLNHMMLTCGRLGQSDLLAFVNDSDETWMRALKLYGFKPAGDVFYKKV